MRTNLQPRQLLVLMDFTSAPLADKPGASVVVQDCILVAEYKDSADATSLTRLNLDFLCTADSNKHDYFFVLQVWVWMFLTQRLNERFDSIDVWSDGGPHHFKTRFCQFMWHALSVLRFSSKRISHHFFASYHGHSLADGHAAIMKRTLKKHYDISELQRLTKQPSATWGPADVHQVASILAKECANTQVKVFDDIYRDESQKPDPARIPSVKAMHCLTYSASVCTRQEKTGEGEKLTFSF